MRTRIRSVTTLSTAWLTLWLLLAAGSRADPPASSALSPPPQAPPATAAPGSAASGAAPAQTGKPLPQVTVEAQRATLEHRLNNFVWSITRSAPRDESLRRWRDPICPLVAGLTHDEDEYILERLSQVARAVGAKLDTEHCRRPNLVVVVTAKPEALIKAWGDRRSAFGGVRGSLAKFSRFADKPGRCGSGTTMTLELTATAPRLRRAHCNWGRHLAMCQATVLSGVALRR